MKRRLQPAATLPQQPDRDFDGMDVIGDPASPYLRTDEAARFLRFANANLFREWAARNRVPGLRRGRALLYDRRVLAAFLEQRNWTKRHADTVKPNLSVVKGNTAPVNEVPR